MQKPIPARTLSRKLFPPVALADHVFLENALRHPFQPRPSTTTGYDPLNAWWLAELSLLAYSEPDFIESELRKVNLELVKPLLNGKSTQGFVAEGDGFTVVAFRGTEVFLPGRDTLEALRGAITDTIADLRFGLVPAPAPAHGRVHRGFLKALDEIFDQLSGVLRNGRVGNNQSGNNRAVWLTGHSLGGALAVLAAARLPRIQGTYVFGAPIAGDAEFGAALKTVRFIHGSDFFTQLPFFAPLLPPRFPFFGRYQPEGEIISIDRTGRLWAGDPNRSLGKWALEKIRQLPTDTLVDHSPLFYAIHLWNLFEMQSPEFPPGRS
jgi:pimeloyl-ACP methyl ester carboxylesterase